MSKRFPNRPILWLPYNPEQLPKPETRGSLDFIGITLSYRQVYGSEPTWDDLEQALAPYSLEQIVDVVCRISAILYSAPLPWDSQTQWRICQGVFGREEANQILQTAIRIKNEMRQKERGAPLLVFHEQQTLNLLKAAFLLKNTEDQNSSTNLVGIGKALLMITDLIKGEPGDLLSVEPTHPDYFDRWLRYLLASYLFTSGAAGSDALARSYDLYLIDKPTLRDCGSYMDLRAMLQASTGLQPDALWSAIFALGCHWTTLSAQTVPGAPMAINKQSYFITGFSFADEEIERFLAICATSVDDMKAAVEAHYAPTSLRPFHILPFAKWPLVAFGDRVYSVSVTFLMQKLTTGLHHLYLDDRYFSKAQRQIYLTYMGEVFGDYVHRALDRMFPPQTRRCLSLDALRPQMKGRYCDGLIAYEEAVLLVETKASLFPLEARVGDDITAIRGRLEDIYNDGAKQIQATIDDLRQGLRDDQGVIPNRINRYYPIVVTLENVPITPVIYGEVRRKLASEGLLGESGVQPLQFINIRELEQIEAVLASGASLKQLIDDKLSRPIEADDSWANYLYRRRDNFKAQTNEYLQELWTRVSERALQFFEERKHLSVQTGYIGNRLDREHG